MAAEDRFLAARQDAVLIQFCAAVIFGLSMRNAACSLPAAVHFAKAPMDHSLAAIWRETAATRVNDLNRHLLGYQTATAALAQWCRMRRLGDGEIRICVLDQSFPATSKSWRRTAYRRVKLFCGTHFLSTAEIRFRCEALSADMLGELRATDRPFGVVVAALGPRRVTTVVKTLSGSTEGHQDSVLVHHATVFDRHDQPIARVREFYQAVLVN